MVVILTEFTSPYSLNTQRGWHASEFVVFEIKYTDTDKELAEFWCILRHNSIVNKIPGRTSKTSSYLQEGTVTEAIEVLRYEERHCAVLKFPLCAPWRLVVEDNSTHAWTRLCIGVRSQLDAPAAVIPQKRTFGAKWRLVGPHTFGRKERSLAPTGNRTAFFLCCIKIENS